MAATLQQVRNEPPQRHVRALRVSGLLTKAYLKRHRPKVAMIALEELVEVLKRAKVTFVIMGTHGVGGWRSEPRATEDVDFLVQKRHHRRAVQAIRAAFPKLQVYDQTRSPNFSPMPVPAGCRSFKACRQVRAGGAEFSVNLCRG